jgi:Leucine-rich repeat (LRR) protein
MPVPRQPTFVASSKGVYRLKAAKAQLNLSNKSIAEQAGVSVETVSRLLNPERGKGVSQSSLEAIVEVLELQLKEIISPEDLQSAQAIAEANRRIQKALKIGVTRLDLSSLGLLSVTPKLGQLTHLTALYLFDNELRMLPKELGQLSNLTTLVLFRNQLTTLPKELGQLSDLTTLNLLGNQLRMLPKELGQLTNLTELTLSRNQLTTLPRELGQLVNLTTLDLLDNQLTMLPKELGQLANLTELYLSGNPQLNIPHEILGPNRQEVMKGATPANPQDILNYYFRIQTSNQPLNEAKLILAGFGEVGKTSLVNRLVFQRFDKDGQFKIEVQRGLMRVKRVLGMALRSQEIYEVYG